MVETSRELKRILGPVPATAIVVGSVIGTGVFLKSTAMTQILGGPLWVLLAWLFAGLLSLCGAIVYSELGARFPDAGGEYVYLQKGFGPLLAFLYGWTRFWITTPAAIAAYAVASSAFLADVWLPADGSLGVLTAILLILAFTALNCLSVMVAGQAQTFLTALKILVVFGLAAGIFLTPIHRPVMGTLLSAGTGTPSVSAFFTATLAALWAYDGWNNLPMMAGEIKNPKTNVPLALGFGMGLVLLLYLAINASYFLALDLPEVLSANSSAFPTAWPIATKAAATFLGPAAIKILAVAFVISAVGAMNGQILSGARVPYAMARSGLFFSFLGRVSSRSRVPILSVLAQGGISILYACTASFDHLTDAVVFASWIFYAATAGVVFVYRPAKSDFRAPGYPLLPITFIGLSLFLVLNAIYSSPLQSLGGLVLIALGVPFYLLFRNRSLRLETV